MNKTYSFMGLTIRVWLLSLILVSCGESRPVLSVYNWGDYIDETVIADFEKEFEVKVVYSLYSTNEEMYVKIKQGAESYDLACPSDYMIERMIREDLLAPLNHEKLGNRTKLDTRFMDLGFDRGNNYSLPYMWGTLGILYNTETVDDPVESWSILWNEKYAGRIGMYNSVRDSLVPALKLDGFSLNTRSADELAAAKQRLMDQKDLVLVYGEDNLKEMVSGGELDLALVYSGDYGWVKEDFPHLSYAVPREGSNLWTDGWVILKDSEQIDLAHEFINYLCREDVALKNAEYVGYASPLPGVVAKLDSHVRNDTAIYPPDEVIENCEVLEDMGDFNAELDKLWTEIMARN